nr:MAG TPA: hypothetical protein [Caudoviricetes sp.]
MRFNKRSGLMGLAGLHIQLSVLLLRMSGVDEAMQKLVN